MKKGSSDKRQQILSSSLELFRSTHQIKKVSLAEIARHARVSPTTIYNLFDTREALVAEVAKLLLQKIIGMGEQYIHSNLPFPEKITGIVSGKLSIASQVDGELLVKVLSQEASIAPFVQEMMRQQVIPLWREMIRDGKAQGYIDPSVDEDTLMLYLDIIRYGFAARPEILRDWEKNLPLIKQLTNLMFFGFFTKDFAMFGKETH